MAKENQSRGKCVFCGEEKTGRGMAKHLAACQERQQANALAEQNGGEREKLYHLQIRDLYDHDYWLHLEMQGQATLGILTTTCGPSGWNAAITSASFQLAVGGVPRSIWAHGLSGCLRQESS